MPGLATTIRPPLMEPALCTLCLTTSPDGIGAYALRLCSCLCSIVVEPRLAYSTFAIGIRGTFDNINVTNINNNLNK